MNLSLVTGCNLAPAKEDDPIYRFDGYWTSRLSEDRWTIKFDDEVMASHFMEQAESVGFSDVQQYGTSTQTLWFTSPTSTTTGTLILSSQVATAVIAEADGYWEALGDYFESYGMAYCSE